MELTVFLGHHKHALLWTQAAMRVGSQDQVVTGFPLKIGNPQRLLGYVSDIFQLDVRMT